MHMMYWEWADAQGLNRYYARGVADTVSSHYIEEDMAYLTRQAITQVDLPRYAKGMDCYGSGVSL